MRLESQLYLDLFSYMPASGDKRQGRFRACKAAVYVPVLGTITHLVFSILLLAVPNKKATPLERKEEKITGGVLALRATLSLIPPLLLIIEGVTTAVDAILRSKNQPRGQRVMQDSKIPDSRRLVEQD